MFILPTLKGLAGNSLRSNTFKNAKLDLNFASTKSLVDSVTGNNLITFTRASTGTYVGADGLLRSAVTNLLLRSEELDNASWNQTASSVSANAIASPFGTTTADKLIENSALAQHYIWQLMNVTASSSYTVSIYAKAAERSEVYLSLSTYNSAFLSGVDAYFTLSSGTIRSLGPNATARISSAGNGWYRCSVSGTAQITTAAIINAAATSNGTTFYYTGDGTSGIYLWGAQLEQSSTVGEYIPTTSTINSAPRFDHNPTTGESLGLLVEEARTNSVTNNTMVGAVAGTPGTNPTGWTFVSAQSNGLTISITGTGVENGINYIDYRFNGTTVASPNACAFGFVNATAATAQTWTNSLYWKLASGTTTGITGWLLGIIENTAVGTFVTGAFYSQTAPTSAALITQRPAATRTLSGGVTVGQVTQTMNVTVAGNTAIDFTIRLGMPQLEQGAFATSVIPTTTATVTRAADVASITGTNFSSWYNQTEGTVFGQFLRTASTNTQQGRVFSFSDGTNTNLLEIYQTAGSNPSAQITATTVQANWTPSGFTVGTSIKEVLGYQLNNSNASFNGSAETLDTVCNIPTLTQARIGDRQDGVRNLNGTIQRLTYWPVRLGNNVLQQITQ